MDSQSLLDELAEQTRRNLAAVGPFYELPDRDLNFKESPESWSILECVEHLNRYGDFYIPEIRRCLEESKFPKSANFKRGLLGSYLCSIIRPQEHLKKMKSPRSMNPNNCSLNRTVLNTFIEQQEALLMLLSRARHTDLTRVKTNVSLSKWIQLRLGDTLSFVVLHTMRHLEQAQKVRHLILQERNPVILPI